MATASVRIPHAARFTTFFPDFLRKELAPYPGRGTIVARTVIAATLTMILIVTFRIPGGAIGAICAFVLSREDLAATAKSALGFLAAVAVGGLFIPIGARMFASIPMTHFLWQAASLFLVFLLAQNDEKLCSCGRTCPRHRQYSFHLVSAWTSGKECRAYSLAGGSRVHWSIGHVLC